MFAPYVLVGKRYDHVQQLLLNYCTSAYVIDNEILDTSQHDQTFALRCFKI